MSLVCIGLSHQTAPIALLERMGFTPRRSERLLEDLAGEVEVREAVVLSTCNRVEFYLVTPQPQMLSEALMRRMVNSANPEDVSTLRSASYVWFGGDAAQHLFRVAAGIDSLIVGEAQILGQLRRAFEAARASGASDECLNGLFQFAIAFGRRVRTETSIGRGNVSVASVACRIAAERMGCLQGKRLLLVGAGETAQLAARHFAKEGLGGITVINRTFERALSVAEALQGEAKPIEELSSTIAAADIIVCATGATRHLLTRGNVARAMRGRDSRPLLLIDLSMPRNIDPEVKSVPGVALYALENLQRIVHRNRSVREAEVDLVERMVGKETIKYLEWAASSRQNQLAATLRRHVAGIHKRVLERHLQNTASEFREQAQYLTDSVLRAAFHDVTERIRNLNPETLEGRRDLETVKRIFGLDDLVQDETGEDRHADAEVSADNPSPAGIA